MTLIGIDLGTSYIKGAILDLATHRLSHVSRVPFPAPLAGLPPQYREYDPDAIMTAVRGVLNDLVPFAGDCEGVVMSSQMHGLVFTTDCGEARSTLTTWQDQRVLLPHPSGRGSFFDVLMAHVSPEARRQLGNELRPGLPIGILYWLAEHHKLPDGDVIPASLPDFVIANLCKCAPVTELTHAQSHGALNLETLNWHQPVISALGLETLRWPEIKRHGEIVGWLDLNGRQAPCFTPVGDYQCAIAGALAQEDELSINISTGSQVSLLRPSLELGPYQTRPFFDGRYAITVTTIPAGRALNALIGLLSELASAQGITLADPWAYITEAADAASDPEMHVHLAFYSGPVGSRGEIANICEEELTVGSLFRAAFRNMAENYHTCALRLSPEQTWRGLVFSGGLALRLDLLRRLIGDKFAKPFRVCPTPEDALFGLLALGMYFTGTASSVSQATSTLFGTLSVRR